MLGLYIELRDALWNFPVTQVLESQFVFHSVIGAATLAACAVSQARSALHIPVSFTSGSVAAMSSANVL